MKGVAFLGFGEDVFQQPGSAGLDGGEAIFAADAVNSSIQLL